jgi:16S rRNA processing protein RimM
MNKSHITIGSIVGTSGIKGYLKVKCFTEDPKDIKTFSKIFDAKGKDYKIQTIVSVKGSVAVVKIAGIESIEDAEKLIGTDLLVDRADLPDVNDGGFYYADLVGMDVFFEDGSKLGVVVDVMNYGASDVLEIGTLEDGKTTMYPFTDDFVVEVDNDARKIIVKKPLMF